MYTLIHELRILLFGSEREPNPRVIIIAPWREFNESTKTLKSFMSFNFTSEPRDFLNQKSMLWPFFFFFTSFKFFSLIFSSYTFAG